MDFEFSKAGTVDSIDKVPPQFKGMYEAGTGDNEGKFVLSETHKPAAEAIDGFNKATKVLRTEIAGLKAGKVDMAPWHELAAVVGIAEGEEVTPDKLKEAIEKLQAQPGQSKANYDRMKADLEKAHERALKAKDGELTQAHSTLTRYLVDSAATTAIAAEKGVPALLLPYIKEHVKVIKEDDDFIVRVVDDSGAFRGNSTGGNMSIIDLVKELKADTTFGRAFESEARQSATGTRPGQAARAGGAAAAGTADVKMTPTQKIAAGFERRNPGA